MQALNQSRRRLTAAGLAAVGASALRPGSAWAAWKPSQVVEFVVPAGPAGALDQVGRTMKQYVDENRLLPKAMVVANKPGGNGKIAFDQLKQRNGDPNVLSVNTHGYIASYLTGNLDVLPHRAFTSIAVLQDEFLVLAVRTESPLRTLGDAIEALRRNPQSLSIAVATSIGNHIHVGTAKVLKVAGVDIRNLVVAPFKSSAESMVALMGGHIDLVAATTPNVITPLQSGKIRLLTVSADKRLGGVFANVPTWREAGVDSDFSSALGIIAPAGISAEQIEFWEGTCRNMAQSALWKELAERNQSRPRFVGAAEATRFYEQETIAMRGIVKELGLLGADK
ncbi:MAG: tripartite tricarboxylate transporter substrate binding protein [Burkholderiales bacterium]|nr:tripartite tricarboxylate transporter substrate binding protein [Burkholderiales bacterium]